MKMKSVKSIQMLFALFSLGGEKLMAPIEGRLQSSGRDLVVGGSSVDSNSYKWFVRIGGGANNTIHLPSSCGGFLVTPEFVITAARCSPLLDVGKKVMIGAKCGNINEEMGGDNCGEDYEIRTIKKRFIPSDFVDKAPFPGDYAIIQLDEAATIKPVMIDNGSFSKKYSEGKSLWVIGLGATNISDDQGITIPDELQHAEVKYRNQNQCFEAWWNLYPNLAQLDNSKMCAGSLEKSACLFDTGGPLYDAENGVIVGIASWEESKCSFKFGSVFTRMSTNWKNIKFILCNLSSFPKPAFCYGKYITSSPTQNPTLERPTTCTDDKMYVVLTLRTDIYAETSIIISDVMDGHEILNRSDFQASTDYVIKKCLPCNQYNLTIFDDYGDGIFYPGGFSLMVDGQLIESSWQKEEGDTGYDKIGYALSVIFSGGWCSSLTPSPTAAPEPSDSLTPTVILSSAPTEFSCRKNEMYVTFELLTDRYPGDNTVIILNNSTGEIAFKHDRFNETSFYIFNECIPCGIHEIIISDSWGDGIKNSIGYSLIVDGKTIVSKEIVKGKGSSKSFGTNDCETNQPSSSPSLSPSQKQSSKPSISPSNHPSTITPEPTSFSCANNDIHMILEVMSDVSSEHNSIAVIKKRTSETVFHFNQFDPETLHVFNKCAPCGLYQLLIFDSSGDGIDQPGGYSLIVDGHVIVKNGIVTGFGNSTLFGTDICTTPRPSSKPTHRPILSPSVAPTIMQSSMPTDEPSRRGMSTLSVRLYQSFVIKSAVNETSAIIIKQTMENYTNLITRTDETVESTCTIIDIARYPNPYEIILVKFVMDFQSSISDVSSYGSLFQELINSDLEKVAKDLNTIGVTFAYPVFQLSPSPTINPTQVPTESTSSHPSVPPTITYETMYPSSSPTYQNTPSPSSFSCADDYIHAELSILADENADKLSVQVRNNSSNEVIEKITDFEPHLNKELEFCLPCIPHLLSILSSSGNGIVSPGGFDLAIDGESIVTNGIVYGFGTAVILYSNKCAQ